MNKWFLAFGGLKVADALITGYGLSTGMVVEANPITLYLFRVMGYVFPLFFVTVFVLGVAYIALVYNPPKSERTKLLCKATVIGYGLAMLYNLGLVL